MNRLLTAAVAVCLLLCVGPVTRGDDTEPLKPVNLDKINTDRDEDDPHLSFSGLALFYSSKGAKGTSLLMSTRASINQGWLSGRAISETVFKEADSRSAFITPDGKYPQHLYFATNKDPEKKNGKGNNFDIFYLIRQGPGSDFTTMTPVQNVDTEEDEMHPWLSANGMQIYFSRKTKEGWRVGLSSKPPGGGQWGEPKLLNLPVGFHHPTLTYDGRTMYAQGPLERSRTGLFRTTLKSGTTWNTPEELTALNHPEGERGDRSPCLSRNGQKLYFASDRPGGKGGMDLYVIDVALLAKKEK